MQEVLGSTPCATPQTLDPFGAHPSQKNSHKVLECNNFPEQSEERAKPKELPGPVLQKLKT